MGEVEVASEHLDTLQDAFDTLETALGMGVDFGVLQTEVERIVNG